MSSIRHALKSLRRMHSNSSPTNKRLMRLSLNSLYLSFVAPIVEKSIRLNIKQFPKNVVSIETISKTMQEFADKLIQNGNNYLISMFGDNMNAIYRFVENHSVGFAVGSSIMNVAIPTLASYIVFKKAQDYVLSDKSRRIKPLVSKGEPISKKVHPSLILR